MVHDLYFEVRRNKLHIYLDAKENSTVSELKNMLEGILKKNVNDMQLWKLQDGSKSILKESDTLMDSGFSPINAKAENPAIIGLLIKGEDQALTITEVSSAPPIPDAMRQEAAPTD